MANAPAVVAESHSKTLPNSALEYRVNQHGSFTQSKKVAGLSRSLESNGHFDITEQRVLWTTTSPLYSEVLIADNSVQERYSADGEFQVTASGENVTTVSRILALIIRSDTEGLKRYFDIESATTSYKLTPRSDALKALFNEVLIQQSTTTVNVKIYEASGTVTDIQLAPTPVSESG